MLTSQSSDRLWDLGIDHDFEGIKVEELSPAKMVDRKCMVAGCDYVVGAYGRVEDTPAVENQDLIGHVNLFHEIGQAQSQMMKDTKHPGWIENQSFELWLEDYELWKYNDKYKDSQYVDRLMAMLRTRTRGQTCQISL